MSIEKVIEEDNWLSGPTCNSTTHTAVIQLMGSDYYNSFKTTYQPTITIMWNFSC